MSKGTTAYRVKRKEHKKRNPLLPVLGIFMGLAVLAIAYLLVPIIVDLIPQLNRIISSGVPIDRMWPPSKERIIFTLIVWAVVFGTIVFIAAIAGGRHPDEDANIKFQKEAVKKIKARKNR